MATNNRLTTFMGPDSSLPPSPSPRLTPQPRTDRQKVAANLRMSSKNQRSASASMNMAHNPEPAYEQSAGVSHRNTVHGGHQMYTAHPPEQDQEQENPDGFDDTTVASEDFDDTIAQGSISNGHNMGGIGVDDEFENGYHRQPLEAVQEDFQDAYDDAYDVSDLNHNYVGDAPAPHQSRKLFNGYDGQGPQTQALGEPLYKQSQSQKAPLSQVPQLPQQNSPPKQKISGRFNQGKAGLANRPKNEMQVAETSRKRTLEGGGVFSPVPKVGNSQLVEDLENAIPRGLPNYTLPPLRTQNIQSAQIDGDSIDEALFEESSHVGEQPALQSRPVDRERFPAVNSQHQKANLNLAAISLDYDDNALKNMNYDDFRDESWEAPSAPSPASEQTSEPDISLSKKSLNERVSHYVEQIASNQEEVDQQRASMAEFFGKLSQDEWEEAGDWFLDRFTGILQALKEARKAKRATVAEFEKEIEKRDRDMQGSLEAYHKDMQRMKRGAKGVIEGNTM